MKLYNKKTVANYIMGNDLDGFDIDELEDNVDFMIDVMRMSSDKEMYQFCSDKVKSDPTFVSFIIGHFSKDEAFITNIADEFLSKSNDEIARAEILVIMNKYLSKDSKKYIKYAVMLFGLKNEKDVMIAASKDLYKDDPEHLSLIGETGFVLLYDEYKQSPIVTDYFAEKALEKILHTDSAEFEDLLHRLFKSPEDLDNINIRTYLIDYISNYDSELASYIGSHPEILNDVLREITALKNKWNTYPKRIEIKKYNMMFEEIHRYMEESGNNCSYTEDELLYAIGKDLGIAREIYKNDTSMPSENDMPYEEALPDTSKLENGVMSYDDLLHYNSIKEIILKFSRVKCFKDLEDLENEYAGASEEDDEIDTMLDDLDSSDSKKSDKKVSNIIDFRTATKK